jgi:L-alanine-DL-glutamate epimerase-like enolase superfamily enzyme
LTGIGETFFGARAVAAWVHETAAPYLLGKDPRAIERHSRALEGFVGSAGTGTENRGRSAVDIALWDLLGRHTGLPLYQLIGGLTRESIPIYNTCAGPTYVRELPDSPDLPVSNWSSRRQSPIETGQVQSGQVQSGQVQSGQVQSGQDQPERSDLEWSLTDPGSLAKDLLAEGIMAMKIWPFDEYAERTDGQHISDADLERGLEPFRQIRDTTGNEVAVIAELHSKWNLPTALRIARALVPYQPMWVEDPLRMDSFDALGRFCAEVPYPTAASETIGSARVFRSMIEHAGVQVVLFDPAWAGGISEALKIAALADAQHLPVAVHDCTGPVNFAVGVHLSCSLGNTFVQEGVRAFYRGWYRELVTELPHVEGGNVAPLDSPGIGCDLSEELWSREDAVVETSSLEGRAPLST